MTKYDNPNRTLTDPYEGQQLGEIWGYVVDGYFKTDEEARNYKVDQSFVNQMINASALDNGPHAGGGQQGAGGGNNHQGGNKNNRNNNNRDRFKKPVIKQEVSEEDVAKQVKETLARLTSKGKSKTSKYRKDKRDIANSRMQEQEDREMADSRVLKITEPRTVRSPRHWKREH